MAEFKRIEVTDPAHANVLNEKIVEPAIELAQKVNKNAEDIAAVDQKVNAHLAETMQYGQIELTVGSGGDFDTINSALEYLSKKYPSYVTSPTNKTIAVIRLLSGFIMQEQVLVEGLNLGWVVIIGDDDKTTINRSALTSNFTIDDYNFNSYPAFGVSKGGILPIVGQLFVMDNSGDSEKRYGIMAADNSRASILTGCGVQNAGDHGIYAYLASIINATGANASNAGSFGICADNGSIINAADANASGAREHGLCAWGASIINAHGTNASNAGGRGIFANQASIINATGANARKGEVDSAEDIYVANGSIIKISSTQTIGGTNQAINTLTGNGIIFG